MYQLTVAHIDYTWLEDVGPEVPLRLADATLLPELGGNFSEKQFRKAIEAGLLPAERHGRTLYVTRAGVKTWRDLCRVKPSRPDSTSSQNAAMTLAPSRMADGKSETARQSSARAAVLTTIAGLRGR